MPEEQEIETKELQETIEEMREERKEREEQERKTLWTRWIALTTACLAVFAAVGALQSGSLVNEAMIAQLKASDTWNEYQADKQKEHLYSVQAYTLLDAGVRAPQHEEQKRPKPQGEAAPAAASKPHAKKADPGAEGPAAPKVGGDAWKAVSQEARLAQYIGQVEKEKEKETEEQKQAKEREEEASRDMERHHKFADAVALIQIAIALSAIAALTRRKEIWLGSLVAGAIGIVLTILGLTAR